MSNSTNSMVASSKVSPEGLDGGLTALGGFFLQFVGTTEGAITKFWVDEDVDPTPDTDKTTLFGVELGDNDAYLRQIKADGQISVRLIQFKFALTPDAAPVQPGDMNTILKKMAEFAEERFQGQAIEVKYIMATNRPRSRDMETVWNDRHTNDANPYFTTYSDFQARLQHCEWEEISAHHSYESIRKWGLEFGLTEAEITSGTLRIISQFTPRVAEGRLLLTIAEVEKLFTDCLMPRRLNSRETRAFIQQNIEDFVRWLLVPRLQITQEPTVIESEVAPPSGDTLRKGGIREELLEELQIASGERPLILLTGDGGNGKSTLLAFLLRAWAEKGFVEATKIDELTDNWISRAVSDWRGDARYAQERSDDALVRLLGFTNERPILLLALDALDENQAAQAKMGEIRRLLNFFSREDERHRPPRATLVVTCRQRADLSGFLGESGHELFAPSEMRDIVKEISVLPFTPDDLRDLIEKKQGYAEHLTEEIRQRLHNQCCGFAGPDRSALNLASDQTNQLNGTSVRI